MMIKNKISSSSKKSKFVFTNSPVLSELTKEEQNSLSCKFIQINYIDK